MIEAADLFEITSNLERGHRFCPGCAEPIIMRQVLLAIEWPVAVAEATGCAEISTSPYPFTSWRIPWIHSAFENAAATIAGVEGMYRSLVRQGKIEDVDAKFVAFAGDGGTYDIGLQSLSGALERGHRFLYVCLNNEAYMNTGIQRSSATPLGAWTTTSPAGSVIPGKREWRKDLTAIVAAHEIPYVAQAAPHDWRDLMAKVRKAVAADGPSFINALSTCPRGWRSDAEQSISISRLAVETCVWPLYEVEDGEWKLTSRPAEKKPVTEWLRSQDRFRHLLRPGNEHVVERFQREVDVRWEQLLRKCGAE